MTRSRMFTTLALLLAVGALRAAPLAAEEQKPAYLDTSRPIDERVQDLVGRMTLEEKVSQLTNHTRAIPRLGVPDYDLWSEALHGVANNGIATVFPQAIGLAASFDPPRVHAMAQAIGLEGRAKYNMAVREDGHASIFKGITFFSPNINIFRDPRWGRGQETYGEDPYLTGRFAVSFITGLQGNDPQHLTAVATAKHYTVHSGPEPLRHQFDAVVSAHDLEDTYLPAFRAAVVDGHVKAVMCVYNAVDGVPGCANSFLLKDTLRQAWGFDGFVTGDCNAVRDIYAGHKYVQTAPEAAAVAIKGGLDNDCVVSFGPPRPVPAFQKYLDAVKQGLLSEAEVTKAVEDMMRTRFELGLFDPPESVKAAQTPDSVVDSDAHRELATQLARESMVLLKNDGVLPLSTDVKKIAVVGPLADSTRVLLGNYNGTPSRATTVLDGIKRLFPGAEVTFEPGTTYLRPDQLVPTSALSTQDGKPGLTAETFASGDFSGAPVQTRVDAEVSFGPEPGTFPDFAHLPPPPPPTRWTGWLTAPVSGTYTLGVEGWSNRLLVDGRAVVDTTKGFGAARTAKIPLEQGHRYALVVENVPRGFAAGRLVWLPPDPEGEARAVAAARDADVVVAVVGITSDLEGEESRLDIPGFKGGDRTRLGLPKEEEQLLEAVGAADTPLVAVLMSGSALAVNWAKEHANAIVQAWYPGEEGGTAVAETLSGANNPAGRLPVTIYTGLDQLPEFTDYSMANRTYRYFDGQPLFPFGYGLSYSRFAYSQLELSAAQIEAGAPLEASVDVKNTSAVDGDEVVQLYLTFPDVSGVPRRALRGFSRVHVPAGQSRKVTLSLDARDLSHVDADGTHLVSPGTYGISVGGGQPGTDAPNVTGSFEITGELQLPR